MNQMKQMRLPGWTALYFLFAFSFIGTSECASATMYYVSKSGNNSNPGTLSKPFLTIQYGLNKATRAGDTVFVETGTYNEAISFPASGSASGGYITLQNYPGALPSINGSGLSATMLVNTNSQSYVKLIGFDIQNLYSLKHDGGGVFVYGSGTNINIENNTIHHFNYLSKGSDSARNGRGIAVWGTSSTAELKNIVISGNNVYDCHELYGNVVEISGNTNHFTLSNNVVHDNTGIQIDITGGYQPPSMGFWTIQARNGIVSGNTVYHGDVNSIGIYAGGSANVTITSNTIYDTTVGIQVASEIAKVPANNIVVEDNLIYGNSTYGLGVGTLTTLGFGSGTIVGCSFLNNTVYHNGVGAYGNVALGSGTASIVASNIFYSGDDVALTDYGLASGSNIILTHNLYYTGDGIASKAQFIWPSGSSTVTYNGLSAFQSATGQEQNGLFAEPLFVNLAGDNFNEAAGSPSIGAGSSTSGYYDPVDLTGKTRPLPSDAGAYQYN
jgi:parallel beta-helix repeat protein